MASKIADGSILDDCKVFNHHTSFLLILNLRSFTAPEMDLLDGTPQPEFEDIADAPVDNQYNTETVFKMIDKMLPSAEKLENDKDLSAESSQNSKNSRSNSAREAIQNLSIILSQEPLDKQLKSEGKNLLSNLADILCSGGRNVDSNEEHSLDSGHSSIEAEQEVNAAQNECFEVLDLRTKSSSSEAESSQALDLSLSSKRMNRSLSQGSDLVPQRASESFKEPKASSSMARTISDSSLRSVNCSRDMLNRFSCQSNQTGSSNDSKNGSGSNLFKGSVLGKLKLKRVSGVSSGPVKAVAAVGKLVNKSKCGSMSVSSISNPFSFSGS